MWAAAMSKADKTITKVLCGNADANIPFGDACALLQRLGFGLRIRGSHHISTRAGVEVLIDLQPRQGKCKPYRVRQVREVFIKFNISL